MPAVWDDEGFSASGFKGLTAFAGRLDSIEEDMPGDYGIQIHLNFEEVEILETESGELFEVDGGFLKQFQKQSGREGSGNDLMVKAWSAFCRKNKLDPPPTGVMSARMRWERQEHSFGPDLSPAKFWVPTEILGDTGFVPPTKEEEPEYVLAEDTTTAVVAILDTKDGVGTPMSAIRRAFPKFTAAVRRDIGAAKDLPTAMDYLVAIGLVEFEDGLYKPAQIEKEN